MSLKLIVLALAIVTIASAGTVVYPGQGWSFIADKGSGGTGQFVYGPATPPTGEGSVELSADGNNAEMFYNLGFGGTSFASITSLSYSTYRASGAAALAIALQFDVDLDLTDANHSYQGRAVYEPYYANTVLDNTWQTWNPLQGAGWWFSRAPQNSTCGQGSTCTWAQLLAAYPNAGVLSGGATLFRAGSNWANFDGNIDNFTLGINGSSTAYDFEPAPEPATWSLLAIGLGVAALRLRRRT